MLQKRFKPHTSTNALNDLRELVFHTDLYGGQGFTVNLMEWEEKLRKFEARYRMAFPDLIKYLILMKDAPFDVASHVCLTYSHNKPYSTIREAVAQYITSTNATKASNQGPCGMDIDVIGKGKSRGKGKGISKAS